MKTLESIINQIKVSEELQKKLVEAAKNNTVAEFLKELGCDATVEEFAAAAKAQSAELRDAELDAVAGGANVDELAFYPEGLGEEFCEEQRGQGGIVKQQDCDEVNEQ